MTKSHGEFLKYDTIEIWRVFQLSYAVTKADIETALKSCIPAQRKRVLLHYFEDYSFREIADMQCCDESAIRRSITAALKKIKKYFSWYVRFWQSSDLYVYRAFYAPMSAPWKIPHKAHALGGHMQYSEYVPPCPRMLGRAVNALFAFTTSPKGEANRAVRHNRQLWDADCDRHHAPNKPIYPKWAGR